MFRFCNLIKGSLKIYKKGFKENLIQLNLAAGTKVKITIHIEATNHDGFSQDTKRTLKENGRILGFGNVEFD